MGMEDVVQGKFYNKIVPTKEQFLKLNLRRNNFADCTFEDAISVYIGVMHVAVGLIINFEIHKNLVG